MTNLLSAISLTFVLLTNWTGVVNGPNELGYLATNHVLTVTYDGGTNEFLLKPFRVPQVLEVVKRYLNA